MSINLQIKDVNFDETTDNQLKLQFIPAGVDESVKANVDNYFNNYTTEKNGVLFNSLRGFPMYGCNFKVPEPYHGVVFQETQKPMDENADRTFKVNGTFDEFTYWNYDKHPSNNDKLKQALSWNEFANELHNPVTSEEFEAADVKTES